MPVKWTKPRKARGATAPHPEKPKAEKPKGKKEAK